METANGIAEVEHMMNYIRADGWDWAIGLTVCVDLSLCLSFNPLIPFIFTLLVRW